MVNAWVSSLISHSTGKYNKIHCIWRNWEIGTHTFPMVWALFSHRIPVLWYTSSYGKWMGFHINFSKQWKTHQNPSHGEKLGNCYLSFSHSMGAFSPLQFTSYGILYHIGNAWVFPLVSHSTGKCNKIYHIKRNWETGTYTFPIVWVLFSQ